MTKSTRRDVLSAIGIAAGACVLPSCLNTAKDTQIADDTDLQTQWKYSKLDPNITAQRAYAEFEKGHCMYAVFAAIIGQLADEHGEPYSQFPLHMMKYGSGGVSKWGSLCGTLNASAAVIGLFVEEKTERAVLTSEVFRWYEETALPDYVPADPAPEFTLAIPATTAESVLCHVSVSNWCKVSGQKAFSPARTERCRRLSSNIAAKTVQVLNAWYDSKSQTQQKPQTCNSCHGKAGALENTLSQMNCTTCHTDISDEHP